MIVSTDLTQAKRLLDAPKDIANAPKWGFVVYRCDYQNDDAWKEFINSWTELIRQDLHDTYKDGDKLLQTMELTVRDDLSLDGASTDKVGMLHAAWAESDELMEGEQARARKAGVFSLARYRYCVHVDTASLASCLKYFSLSKEEKSAFYYPPRDPAMGLPAHVNLICTTYPRAINHDDLVEEFGDDYDDSPVSIRVHLPAVLPEMYKDVEGLYDIWAGEATQDPDGVVFG